MCSQPGTCSATSRAGAACALSPAGIGAASAAGAAASSTGVALASMGLASPAEDSGGADRVRAIELANSVKK